MARVSFLGSVALVAAIAAAATGALTFNVPANNDFLTTLLVGLSPDQIRVGGRVRRLSRLWGIKVMKSYFLVAGILLFTGCPSWAADAQRQTPVTPEPPGRIIAGRVRVVPADEKIVAAVRAMPARPGTRANSRVAPTSLDEAVRIFFSTVSTTPAAAPKICFEKDGVFYFPSPDDRNPARSGFYMKAGDLNIYDWKSGESEAPKK